MREPLVVRVEDETRAIALAHELMLQGNTVVCSIVLTRPGLRRRDGAWEPAVDGADTDRLVVRVLDAVRQVLAGEPTATALVQMDGREYQMNGE